MNGKHPHPDPHPDLNPDLTRNLGSLAEAVINNLFNVPEALVLEGALVRIASDAEVVRSFPDVSKPLDEYRQAESRNDPAQRECALLELYLCLHALGSEYSELEHEKLRQAEGISNLPGGMFPIVAASRLLGPDNACMDLGAGNGLQGLLLQSLLPHRKTSQVELSGKMIEAGKMFQRALGINADRVEWICGDIASQDLAGVDLLYMYRPLKPYGKGIELYEEVARRLSALDTEVTVLSVADCLGKFLNKDFNLIYSNEFFSCYRGPAI